MAAFTKEKLGYMREMAAARWPQKRIAAVLNISQSLVCEALKEHGIEHLGPIRRGRSTAHQIVLELRAERIARHLSVKELARRSGYAINQISEWERGGRRANLDAIEDIARCLGRRVVLLVATP